MKSDVILVREELSCLPCPVLHLTQPYRLAPLSTTAMHTSNCNMNTRRYILYLYIMSMSLTHKHTHTFTATDITDQQIMYSVAMYQLYWLSHVRHQYHSRYINMDLAFERQTVACTMHMGQHPYKIILYIQATRKFSTF